MMDWTDRHCRYFLRQFAPGVLLYTEMITAAAIQHGNRDQLLGHSPEEHPLAAQLGGSDPAMLALAAREAADRGYVEINLNCGCPSDRVSAGAFGACLMLVPQRVAECVAAMRAVVDVPVTVKLRIGVVDRQAVGSAAALQAMQRFDAEDFDALLAFSQTVVAAGAQALIVHARKAVLGGLSPHENRTVPPLHHAVVARLRAAMPSVPVILNGGLRTVETVTSALQGVDGVMIGREAYHRPWLLAELQQWLQPGFEPPSTLELLERMRSYAHTQSGPWHAAAGDHTPHAGLAVGAAGCARHAASAFVAGAAGHGVDALFDRARELAGQVTENFENRS